MGGENPKWKILPRKPTHNNPPGLCCANPDNASTKTDHTLFTAAEDVNE
jgi:hypothetical protein